VAEALAGSVTPEPNARWQQVRDGGVERVTLEEGTLGVHVRHQAPPERFLVMLPDGELEVRGTTFQVTVARGVTTRVHVDEGWVEVRLRGGTPASVGAGQTWPPPVSTTPSLSTTPSSIHGPGPAASPPAATSADVDAAAYAAAVDLLRQGHPAEAAAAFQAFALAHPHAAQAEDATFLQAVALARAGRADAAGFAAEQHLARFPASFHRKEASILVARAAVLRGDCALARSALAAWRDDADARAALSGCAAP